MAGKRYIEPWFAVSVKAFESPQLDYLRVELDSWADLFYVRILRWCKLYQKHGSLKDWWPSVAKNIGWLDLPGRTWESLRELLRKTGVVVGDGDTVWNWYETNGWIIKRNETQAASMARLRAQRSRAGKAAAKSRAARRQLALLAGLPKAPRPRQSDTPEDAQARARTNAKATG